MRFRRRLPILIVVLLIAGAVALLVTLRKHAPPEAARLLPGADGFFYINLKWIRTFNATAALPPVSRDPEFQKFVDETGFQFERDLDEAAFAVHYPESWGDGTAGNAAEARTSEIFVGKFNSSMMLSYLKRHASSIDRYREFDIYNIPSEGRIVRVTFLSFDSVAVSNHPDPDVIRGMIDRSRKLASPFGGPSLLRRFYKEVPLVSLSFAILQVKPAAMNSLEGFGSWSVLFPKPAVVVVSARYLPALHLPAVHLKAEAFTDSEGDAQSIVDKVGAFLSLFHAAAGSVGAHGTDADVKAFFDSLKVERSGERSILVATVPQGFIKKALTETPADTAPAGAQPTPPQAATPPLPRQSPKPKKP
jgi:hypothetical protein